MAPTMKEIAELAKVSRATVSRVFSHQHTVSEETRRIVLEAAEKLNYQHHRTQNSGEYLVVLPGLDALRNPAIASVVAGIRDALPSHSLTLADGSFCPISNLFPEEWLRGVFLVNWRDRESAPALEYSDNLSIMTVTSYVAQKDTSGISYIGIDRSRILQEAVIALRERGHQEIALITYPQEDDGSDEFVRGFRLGLARSRGLNRRDLIVMPPSPGLDGGYQAAGPFLKMQPRPTAVIAADDFLAMGFVGALRRAGVRVPQEVSVLGIGDFPASECFTPALSTIRIPFREIGRWSAYVLEHSNQDAVLPDRVLLPTEIIWRDTTTDLR